MTLSIQTAHAMETTVSNKEWFIHYAGRKCTVENGKTLKEAGGIKKAFCFKYFCLKLTDSISLFLSKQG